MISMSDTQKLSVISYYINKWESILHEVKYISTVDVFTLFRGDQEKLSTFISVLQDLQNELLLDYQKYLLNYFYNEESALSVINRVLFYSLWMSLARLSDAIQTKKDSRYEYLYHLNIPPATLFHESKILSCAEIIRYIHLMSIDNHCVTRSSKVELNTQKNDQLQESQYPATMLLSVSSKRVNDLLHFISILYSYPSIPIYAGGYLASAEILKEPQISLLQLPSYINNICSACKINNLEYGITDEIEQKQKLPCNCIFIQSGTSNQTLHMHISTIRSQMIQRMAFLHGQICKCNIHKNNCIQDMENIEQILPTKTVNIK